MKRRRAVEPLDDSPTQQLGRDLDNVGLARDWLTRSLHAGTTLSDERIGEAAVMVSELVTNVIRHTRCSPTVTLHRSRSEVRLEVFDDAGGQAPVMRPIDPLREGGNGVRIVDAFASSWGVRRCAGSRKAVWFAVAL
jgi:anti-sigma regulatory factor (Ser/Thr protein kinase)